MSARFKFMCLMGGENRSGLLLTTLKQEPRGESGEENRKLQLKGLVAAFGECFATRGGFVQAAASCRGNKRQQMRTGDFDFKLNRQTLQQIRELTEYTCPTTQLCHKRSGFSACEPSGSGESFPASLSLVPNRPADAPVQIKNAITGMCPLTCTFLYKNCREKQRKQNITKLFC